MWDSHSAREDWLPPARNSSSTPCHTGRMIHLRRPPLLQKSVEFILGPLLLEETLAEDHDPKAGGRQTLINSLAEAVAYIDLKLIEPDLVTAVLKCLSEWARNLILVLARMTDEAVAGKACMFLCVGHGGMLRG